MFLKFGHNNGIERIYISHFLVAILALVLVFGSWFTVSQGQVAVTKTFGKLNSTIHNPGLSLKLPIITSVIKYDIKTNKQQEVTTSASKDLQNVTAEIAVNFSIQKTQVRNIYENLGDMRDIVNKVINPSINEVVKQVTAKYTAEELITKRNQVSSDITEGLKDKLEKHGVNVNDVNIINFKFSDGFDKAIEAKVQAEQDALAQKNLLEKVKYEAEQRVVTAKAEAESIRIQAESISKQGGSEFVKLRWIEKWDGKLPTTTLGENPMTMLNIK